MPEWRKRDTQRARELRSNPTPAERALWRCLSGSKLNGYKFSRQLQIGPFYADLICRSAKLIVELDGDTHAQTTQADARRTAHLKQLGYAVIRFSNADVLGNLDGVCDVSAEALADRPTPNPSRKREGS